MFVGFVKSLRSGKQIFFVHLALVFNLWLSCHCRWSGELASGQVDVVTQTPEQLEGKNTDGNSQACLDIHDTIVCHFLHKMYWTILRTQHSNVIFVFVLMSQVPHMSIRTNWVAQFQGTKLILSTAKLPCHYFQLEK